MSENPGFRYPRSVLHVPSESNTVHHTQKPLALFEYLIKTYTNPGELVLDSCMGSGTTAIACLNTGRNFIGFELDPECFQAAQHRLRTRHSSIQESGRGEMPTSESSVQSRRPGLPGTSTVPQLCRPPDSHKQSSMISCFPNASNRFD